TWPGRASTYRATTAKPRTRSPVDPSRVATAVTTALAASRIDSMGRLRVAILLAGLGRAQRGAEAAFLELARRFACYDDLHVELFGTGPMVPAGMRMHQLSCVRRERFEAWPRLPCLRSEYEYEELTFIGGLLWSRRFRPRDFDLTLSCSYPYVNWFL